MEDEAAAHMEALVEARPIQVNIETTTLCNARCTFCAYPKVSRPKSVMTMDVFEQICRDFEALGGGLLGLSPMMSDPLVDPFVVDRIRLVNEKFPTIRLHMFTNLIGLSRFLDDEVLLLLRSLRHINVSIGGSKQTAMRRCSASTNSMRFTQVCSGSERSINKLSKNASLF
jgi:MoaA/NifB/PqqE/SkfB family radical SAM enzyme